MNEKCVLITGANRGIGLEIAKQLASKDYKLFLLTSRAASSSELSTQKFLQDVPVKISHLDLTDLTAIDKFANNWDGQLWGIVNNAGICKTLELKDEGNDPLDEILATNLIGPYYLTKKLLKHLSRPSRIINIASQLGQEGRAGYSAYCASKFALIGMTKCWAKELGGEGITVNAICPGWVDTEMSRIDMKRMAQEKGIEAEHFYADICKSLELKRFNSTKEVASLVAFLLSAEASGITGRDWLMQTLWNQQ